VLHLRTIEKNFDHKSFFDRQGIPEILFQSYYKDSDDDVDFEDDLHTLINYTLLTTNAEGNELEMHQVVQFSRNGLSYTMSWRNRRKSI
jgi:hypothetical protein